MENLRLATDCLVQRMLAYSQETGISMEKCMHDALELYLDIEADPVLEELRKPALPKLRRIK